MKESGKERFAVAERVKEGKECRILLSFFVFLYYLWILISNSVYFSLFSNICVITFKREASRGIYGPRK